MIGNELSDFLLVGSEFLFSSAFVFLGSDGVGIFVLLAKIVDAGEADGIFFGNIFTVHTVVAIVQDADSQVNRIGSRHYVLQENEIQNSPSLTIFPKIIQTKCKHALEDGFGYVYDIIVNPVP